MSDDKTQRTPADASRISLEEDYEVAYWTDALDVGKDQLREAVDAVGNSADAVKAYLGRD